MLIGSAIRYLASRNAVQTVYWRTTKDSAGGVRMVKHKKLCNFGPKNDKFNPTLPIKEFGLWWTEN